MAALLARLLLRLFGLLPLRINQAVGGALGASIWLLSPKLRRITLTNLALCFPESDPAWRRRTGRRSLIESTRALTEAPWLWRQTPETLRGLLHPSDDLKLLHSAGQHGEAILATPHLGSWEFAGLYLATLRPTTALYRPPRMQALDGLIRAARAHTGSRLVPTTPTGLRALRQALARGEAVGLLPDQTPKGGGGVFAPFFGHPAYTMRLLSTLARRACTPVVLAYFERLPRGQGFRLHSTAATDAIYNADTARAAAELNRCVESLVRQCPEQYLWSYRRFNRYPPGAPDPYATPN
ncbi:lipid A biosynthesis acyltransferase [Acidihalobacter ferrooxydans]|uniref:Lipid A biosynthesis acyltransferase n=1 Tax=Acidihalobacter ferrooxydans TaxID=1765967 RepID=A0A1P8UKX7_9GAMM|nr:lipid A biosynthesis acyltransferase [Acidihalobacter ferrooxydans]APZ44414.1 lipid A biosynthesis acyltransferase [Acidihalobacter ferrooxydans]